MEQVMYFLTAYADEISGAALLLVIVLLLVALHRIKRVEKRISEWPGRAEIPGEEPVRDGMETGGVQTAEAAACMETEETDTPEELLDAVLGEVFS